MAFSSKTIANNFLEWDYRDGSASITPMKIQKLVYLVHGWFLAIHDEPLIEESFEAWPYGPVEDTLYHIFKPFKNSPITSYAKTWHGEKESAQVVKRDNEKFYDVFDAVTKKYGAFSALKLSALTHQQGTPWSITRAKGDSEIDNDLIKSHFRSLIANG